MSDQKPIENSIAVLILQHPQEKKRPHGTAKLITETLDNAMIKTGFSWKSLSAILKQEEVEPKEWGVLYLGTKKHLPQFKDDQSILVLDAKGNPKKNSDEIIPNINGIILLDGSWSDAKTLWWRNSWLLKTNRLVLNPKKISPYKKVRRSPRKENLSTLEAAAFCLDALGETQGVSEALLSRFETFLKTR